MDSDSQVYTIIDIEGYAQQIRKEAAKSISEGSKNEELDEYISIEQIIGLVNNNCLGFDEEDRPQLNETLNRKIFEETAIWIHNVGLAKLAAKDFVECAWDDEINEMVFWQKNET